MHETIEKAVNAGTSGVKLTVKTKIKAKPLKKSDKGRSVTGKR